MSVCAVVGGQFGSEGKGAVVAHIAGDYNHHVRVGAANAGHTFYTRGWWQADELDEPEDRYEKHVMQQLPCAAYANPGASLYIGPGALISADIFEIELLKLRRWREDHGLLWPKIYVDARAHVILEEQKEREMRSGLAERIGSTSATAREGIGIAQSDRVMRSQGCILAETMYGDEEPEDVEYPIHLADVPAKLASAGSVLLEGTQGASLSLTTGAFPYITSRNTTSAGLCADAGVAPTRLDRVILVCRTFPIRVAGNSGSFWWDSVEVDWASLGVEPEKTTVTKKERRIATFSMEQVQEAAMLNGATEIALMFCDYIDPEIKGISGEMPVAASAPVSRFVDLIEHYIGVPVRYLGTGPRSIIHLRDPR